ncbi:serine/threonine-protein kinase [Streptomyces sp. NBC_00286]|uniref:serine/threonine-protein kinase n=1 Tax=Streptomyces sp. NBC_00286 TaxID=2975701 RepID=UPI002E2AE58F|nr:protein kinase [Streptomyces sp. NBC_00286]
MSSGANESTDGVGRLLAGRYRVVAQLGRGGMGVVWRALDEVLGREVAVKELRTYTDAGGPELADLGRRMQREARAAARVRHPGVIAVHDVAEVDGRPLIVMELVDGPSLDDVLREEGPCEPGEAAEIGAKVMDALAAAHRAGVLHRDVKPGNILLDRSGRVVLTDFGIATMEDPGDGATTHLTRSGELVGSLDYLAPERAQGHDFGPASDVWALGATLYAAVEGTSPFRRTSTWSTLTAIVSEPLPEPRASGPLAPVLQELMQKQPEDRPDADRARELLEAVARAAGQDSATTNLGGPAAKQREATERSAPAVPPGFGPPGSAAPGPAAPQPQGETTASDSASGRGPRPRKARALLAAAAVTAVLAATGVTVALLTNTDDSENSARPSASQEAGDSPSSADPSPGTLKPSDDPTEQGDKRTSPTPGPGKPERTEAAEPTKKDPAPAPSATDDGGSTGGNSGGTSGGGGGAEPAPGCESIGGGKYNCDVWRTATSYTADGTEVGTLNEGINYFYCQQNLGRRETYGEWTNIWWAKTDDDSGNKDVFISDVYIKGGDNDQPVPGLPLC